MNKVALDPRHRDRSEPLVTLVIHEGTADQATAISRQADRILVTIHADDLLNPDRGDLFIRSHIAEQVGAVDLFGNSSPVRTDAEFFGRVPIAEQLALKTLTASENAGVFGLRKTGKTSVLRALQRRAESHSRLVVYVDCESPGIYNSRWWSLLALLVRRAAEAAGLSVDGADYNETTAPEALVRDIKVVVTRLGLSGVTFLLDEVEYITPKISGLTAQHWDADFVPLWQTLRAVQQ